MRLEVRQPRRRARRLLSALLASALALPIGAAAIAQAATVHEITGAWVDGTPTVVRDGDVVNAEWRINVNDDAPAPANDPVDDVTVRVQLAHGTFEALPSACLVDGVTPPSSISPDGSELVCNLGTKDQGTAVVLQTPVIVAGVTGDEVSATGTISGVSAAVPPLRIENAFGMDMLWGQSTGRGFMGDQGYYDADFQWTLNLDKGSEAGPQTIDYDVTLTGFSGRMEPAPTACGPFTAGVADGHPWSGGDHPDEQLSPFVDACTVQQTGANTFRMTITGIDYSPAARATKDSAGTALPTNQVAVASGSVVIRLFTSSSGDVQLQASAPTYTSVGGATATDDPTNNASAKSWLTLGGYSSTWNRTYTGSGGSNWDAQYRVSAGTEVASNVVTGLMRATMPASTKLGMCTTMDTRYVTFVRAQPSPIPDAVVEYYVGSNPSVTPASGSYNPNAFLCNEGGAEVGAMGWTQTVPTDLTTVRAVRIQYTHAQVAQVPPPNTPLTLVQQINADAPTGADVWQFSSYRQGGDWEVGPRNTGCVTPTPGLRYPCTNGLRDVIRVVSATPSVDKSVDRSVLTPGVPATYTLTYSANGTGASPNVDGYVLRDTLPVGLTYIPGSTTPEPTVSTDADGRQVLTWTLNGVPTNVAQTLTYQVAPSGDLTPGEVLTNTVLATYGGQESPPAKAQVTVASDGYTTIVKTADQAYIPNIAGDGVGSGSWTVTLRSYDPSSQAFTDTIDILPWVGDKRGTSFTGSYQLDSVTAVPGATVYYTTHEPAHLSDDPADASNGAAGDVTGNTVGWTTTATPDATAVRVVGPALPAGGLQEFTVAVTTDGVVGGDVLVNRAQGRTGHTQLVMRTSATTAIANYYSASLKKYVQDQSGQWRDANDATTYPTYRIGDTVPYRIVITNTGQGTLTDVDVTDDQFPDGSFTVTELASGASEVHEFTVVLDTAAVGSLVNTACGTAATPADSQVPPTINCDPAGIEVVAYDVTKVSDPSSGSVVSPGDIVTYTVTVTQHGDAAVSGATFTDDLAAVLDAASYNDDARADLGTVSRDGEHLVWTGDLGVGDVATVTYTVTVTDAGDNRLRNVVTSPGCLVPDDCTTNHDVAWFTFDKVADPEDGSTVAVGDTVDYTVTVVHHGAAPLTAVSVVDDLTGVLDDAAYNDDATAATGAVAWETPKLTWTGDLALQEKTTFTYSVTVTGPGDHQLVNQVTTQDPRGSCVEGSDCSTVHEYGTFTVSKTSDPKSGSTVGPGDTITYTITVTQNGPAPVAAATFTDDLSAVLDDATYNDDVSADVGAPTVREATLSWTGDLAVDAVVTVTYSVTVTGEGDDRLQNVVTTTHPAGACDTTVGCETDHLVPPGGPAPAEPPADVPPPAGPPTGGVIDGGLGAGFGGGNPFVLGGGVALLLLAMAGSFVLVRRQRYSVARARG